jgi:hypothetical protein
MEKFQNLGDKRQEQFCVYCGNAIETREHVPSRVFLDEPFPNDLPTVGACQNCNQMHSLDEEYVACLVECVKAGSVDINIVRRKKVRDILSRKPALSKRLQRILSLSAGGSAFKVELDRIKSVLLKLARCHLLFEQNEPPFGDPIDFNFGVLGDLSEDELNFFESPPELMLSPEVGSRSMQRMLIYKNKVQIPWVTVQKGVYRYLITGVQTVRIVIGEYLWCQAEWSN